MVKLVQRWRTIYASGLLSACLVQDVIGHCIGFRLYFRLVMHQQIRQCGLVHIVPDGIDTLLKQWLV